MLLQENALLAGLVLFAGGQHVGRQVLARVQESLVALDLRSLLIVANVAAFEQHGAEEASLLLSGSRNGEIAPSILLTLCVLGVELVGVHVLIGLQVLLDLRVRQSVHLFLEYDLVPLNQSRPVLQHLLTLERITDGWVVVIFGHVHVILKHVEGAEHALVFEAGADPYDLAWLELARLLIETALEDLGLWLLGAHE